MTSTTKSTESNEPPKFAAPLYDAIGKDALALYQSGQGLNPYPGSTVADFSPTTLEGLDALTAAGRNTNTAQTRGQFSDLASDARSNPFIKELMGLASGGLSRGAESAANSIGTLADRIFGSEGGILSQFQNPSAAATNLQGAARGDYLENGNPLFDEQLGNTLDDVARRTKSSTAGKGRSGSSYDVRTLADSLGETAVGARADQWNKERDWQLQSNSLIDAAENARLNSATNAGSAYLGAYSDRAGALNSLLGTRGGILTAGSNAYGQGIDQSLAATGAMKDLDQQQFVNSLAGADAILKAGGMQDDKAQAKLSDYVSLWDALENQEWNRMGAATAMAGGVAGPYGVTNSRSSTSDPAGFASGLLGAKKR